MKQGLTTVQWSMFGIKWAFRWNMRHLGWKRRDWGNGHGYSERGPLLLEW